MQKSTVTCAAALAMLAGTAMGQITVDGVVDASELAIYGAPRLGSAQVQPTSFGDNGPGQFSGGGVLGDPENVATGVELVIPLSAIGNPSSFSLFGYVTSGDRSFISNQLITNGGLPELNNIGNPPNDFSSDPDFAAGQIFVEAASIVSGTPVLDAANTEGEYPVSSRIFLQQNFTAFGDNGDATEIGGGGSEIDAVYALADSTNLYLFIAGNLEANGNALDLFIDSVIGGATQYGVGTGDGAAVLNGQVGDDGMGGTLPSVFDNGFQPDFILSIDSIDDDEDEMTPNVPRALFGAFSGNDAQIDAVGNLAGYGAANAAFPTGGSPAIGFGIDNSNTAGVTGTAAATTPVSPDSNWSYGSELNNVRARVDVGANRLYLHLAGNMEVIGNRLLIFLDAAPGGQNVLRTDNIDLVFDLLNNLGGLTFDAAFEADYVMVFNTFVDGGSGNLGNFTNAGVLRTNGPLLDQFNNSLDYGAFFGGFLEENDGTPIPDDPMTPRTEPVELMDFSGPRVDIPGSGQFIFTEFSPRITTDEVVNNGNLMPPAGLLQVAYDGSNVAGVTADLATTSAGAARQVTTGLEISIDLDELGWDGTSDIRVTAIVANGSSDDPFLSNQVTGNLAFGDDGMGGIIPAAQLGDDPTMINFEDDVANPEVAGEQFVVLTGTPPCSFADLVAPFGVISQADVSAFVDEFFAGGSLADLVPPFGVVSQGDVAEFVDLFFAGCPMGFMP
ncbi:MAG: hypothetical protein AAFQ71_03690 [Planctomycetota bacterium]